MAIITCIPTRGLVHSRTIEDVLKNTDEPILFAHGLPVPEANNDVTRRALELNPSHIWFVDDDMALPEGILQELIAADTDIALADYPVCKDIPTAHFRDGEFLYGGLGCVLVKADVLHALGEPYFSTAVRYSFKNLEPARVKHPYKEHGLHDVHFFRQTIARGAEVKVIETTVGQYHFPAAPRPKGNDTGYEVEEWRL